MTPLLMLLAAGCGTEIGNPELDFAALARTTRSDDVGVGAGPGVVVDEAIVTLREIRLEAADRCDRGDGVEAEIEGPWTVDLVTTDALPIQLDTRSLCRVRLRVDRAEGGELDDVSIRISGRRADDVPFVIESRDMPDLELRSRSAETFTIADDAEELLLTFDVARWLTIDLGALAPGPDGTIRVDEDTNDEVLDAFDDALEDSLELFEGAGGVRDVGPDATPLATAS